LRGSEDKKLMNNQEPLPALTVAGLGFIWQLSSDSGAASSVYLPQLVGDRLQAAARNLIDAANRHYEGTGIQ
jgi:hypothetical protein